MSSIDFDVAEADNINSSNKYLRMKALNFSINLFTTSI